MRIKRKVHIKYMAQCLAQSRSSSITPISVSQTLLSCAKLVKKGKRTEGSMRVFLLSEVDPRV